MRTPARVRRLLSIVVCCAAVACASAGTAASRDVPPRLLSQGPPVTLRIAVAATTTSRAAPPPSAAGQTTVRLSIEVDVDEHGRADVSTLKVFGPGSAENRTAIQQWAAEARFEPARRDGVAVRGVYRLTIDPSRPR